jgi:hypothetical protein
LHLLASRCDFYFRAVNVWFNVKRDREIDRERERERGRERERERNRERERERERKKEQLFYVGHDKCIPCCEH